MQRIGVSSLEAPANKLLAKLPAAERRRLLPILKPLTLSSQQVLQKPGDPLHMIYFPGEGVYFDHADHGQRPNGRSRHGG